MGCRRFVAGLALACLATAQAAAQQQPPTVVQLPTFSFFTVSTTVLVPDRGGAYLGGVRRAQSGRTRFGMPLLPGQGAAGGNRQAAGVHVAAQIHDLAQMDEDLLAGARPPGSLPAGKLGQKLALARQGAAGEAVASVAELKQGRAASEAADNIEALALVDRGQRAEDEGKPGVARIHYQMASRRATGELQEQIAARLTAIEQTARLPKIAVRP